MKHGTVLGLALLASTAIAAPATAQATFRQLAGTAATRGGFGDELFGPGDSEVANSYPVGPVSASATFGDTQGTAAFTASASAGGSLIDASRGTLTFSAATSASAEAGDPGTIARAIANAAYVFSVDSLSRLSFDYTLAISGNSPALYLRLVELAPNNNILRTLLNQSGIRTPGAMSFDLTSGTYELRFSNNVNTAVSTANPGRDADSISGTMNFQIAAVPEPGSWMLMLAGFGLAGSALRTSRRRVAFA